MNKSKIVENKCFIGILFVASLIFCNDTYSQSIKNITLGEKYSGPELIETSVGGYNGTLKISKLSNGVVVNIVFISKRSLTNILEAKMFINEVEVFLANVQNNYKISFDRRMWKHEETVPNSGNIIDIAFCTSGNTSYTIHFTIDLKGGKSELQFGFFDIELRKQFLIEMDSKRNTDF